MGDSSGEECALQIDVGKAEGTGKGPGGNQKKKKSSRPPVNWTPGEVVWAKVTGFSFWPAKVFDADNDELVPKWMKPAPRPTYILVRFFGTYDMQWVSGNSAESYEKGLKKRFQKKSKSKSFLKAISEAKQFVDSGVVPEGLTQRPLDPPDMETEENEEVEDKSNTSQDDDSAAPSGRRSRRNKGSKQKSNSSTTADDDSTPPASKKAKIDSTVDDSEPATAEDEVKAFTSAPLPQSSKEKQDDKNAPQDAVTDEAGKLSNGGSNDKKEEKSENKVPAAES